MSDFTQEFIKISSARGRTTEGDSTVAEVFDLMRSGQSKIASHKLASMTDDQVRELNSMIKKASSPEIGTVTSPPNEVASAANRTIRQEGTADTSVRPADEATDIHLKPGLDNSSLEQFSPEAPEVEAMLATPIEEMMRQPAGDSSSQEVKKTAGQIFVENYRLGVQDGLNKIAALVQKKGRLNLASEYDEPFKKIAAQYGVPTATEVTLRAHADGMRETVGALISNEEVKMGSLDRLLEGQKKVASPADLGAFARELGKQTVITKIANMQAMEEAAAAEGAAAPEEAELMEAAAAVEELVDQAQNAPETLTDEEAEFLLELSQEVENEEAQMLGGMESVSSVMDYVAALRRNGWVG